MVFYGFSKLQPKTTKGERIHLLTGPWKGFGSHTCTLGLHKRPWKKKEALQRGPWGGRRRGRPDSGELTAVLGRRSGGGGPRAHTTMLWREDHVLNCSSLSLESSVIFSTPFNPFMDLPLCSSMYIYVTCLAHQKKVHFFIVFLWASVCVCVLNW
jgi:hypothetical protein